eukprot:SAG31_NODE_6368_length_2041_cov_11.623069_2_plen_69_part_00
MGAGAHTLAKPRTALGPLDRLVATAFGVGHDELDREPQQLDRTVLVSAIPDSVLAASACYAVIPSNPI